MHRLAIVDLVTGDQPLLSLDAQISLLGNGEIYNAWELREALGSDGSKLASRSDFAPLAEWWSREGLNSLKRSQGMFALSVVDRRNNTVTLARDRLGEKPLYTFQRAGELWWSSELLPLIHAGIADIDLDPISLRNFLIEGICVEPRTPIRGIQALDPGTALVIDTQSLRAETVEYWTPWNHIGDKPENLDELHLLLDGSVRKSLASDVPIAVALSGGLDSTFVAATARKYRDDIAAFTVQFDRQTHFNEGEEAAQTSKVLRIPHRAVTFPLSKVAETFLRVCVHRDLPVADVTGPAYDLLCQEVAGADFKVLLTGQGADELFWGYRWITRWLLQAESFDLNAHALSWMRALRVGRPQGLSEGADWIREGFGLKSARKALGLKTDVGASSYPLRLQSKWFQNQIQIERLVGSSPKTETGMNARRIDVGELAPRLLIGLLQTYLRSNGLAQIDRLSMRYGLEARTPLVDQALVEYVLAHSAGQIRQDKWSKEAFRSAVARDLPPEVLSRPKSGFRPPVKPWLEEIWRSTHDLRRSPQSPALLGWDASEAKRVLRRPIRKTGEANHLGLRLLTLEVWLRDAL